jgi:hypothetical protein
MLLTFGLFLLLIAIGTGSALGYLGALVVLAGSAATALGVRGF